MPDTSTADEAAMADAELVPGTTYYLSFNTADPGGTGAAEGSGLTRQPITFAAAAGGTKASNSAQTFTAMPGGVTYPYFSVWTAASGPTFKRGGTLTSPITPSAGSSVTVASGQISFTIA